MSSSSCGCDPDCIDQWGQPYVCVLHRTTSTLPLRPPLSTQPIQEVRMVDPTTGGEKGQKLQRYDLIPPEFEQALAEVYGRGARKYADRNWEKGYAWGLSVAALRRHLTAWLQGESLDPDTGAHHLAQVAWHAATLYTYEHREIGRAHV